MLLRNLQNIKSLYYEIYNSHSSFIFNYYNLVHLLLSQDSGLRLWEYEKVKQKPSNLRALIQFCF